LRSCRRCGRRGDERLKATGEARRVRLKRCSGLKLAAVPPSNTCLQPQPPPARGVNGDEPPEPVISRRLLKPLPTFGGDSELRSLGETIQVSCGSATLHAAVPFVHTVLCGFVHTVFIEGHSSNEPRRKLLGRDRLGCREAYSQGGRRDAAKVPTGKKAASESRANAHGAQL